MQIIFVYLIDILPCPALEHTCPVVRRAALAETPLLSGAPYVVVVVGAVLALLRGSEPRVLVGGVVNDKVHKYTHTALMRAVKHLLEDIEIAVIGVDVHIIGDVVAVVRVGRGIKRRKPYCIRPQTFDIIKLGENTPEIAYAVAVAVTEAARPYLVNYHVLVPLHGYHPCFQNIFPAFILSQLNLYNNNQNKSPCRAAAQNEETR